MKYKQTLLIALVLALFLGMLAVLFPAVQDKLTASQTSASSKEKQIDPCKLKQPCKECAPIHDKIAAACKRLDEIDKALKEIDKEKTKNTNEQKSIKDKIALLEKQAGPANRIDPLQQNLDELIRTSQQLDNDTRKLTSERTGLDQKLQEHILQMKECEKTHCASSFLKLFSGRFFDEATG